MFTLSIKTVLEEEISLFLGVFNYVGKSNIDYLMFYLSFVDSMEKLSKLSSNFIINKCKVKYSGSPKEILCIYS